MGRFTAPTTIADYREAYRKANGRPGPEVRYVHGWFRFREIGQLDFEKARHRERDVLAMTDRLLALADSQRGETGDG